MALSRTELRRIATAFGVSDDQVRRDHLLSHVLAALARLGSSDVAPLTFFGGTALARTWLTAGRLSEDVDLFTADRTAWATMMEGDLGLRRQLRRTFLTVDWQPAPSMVRGATAAVLVAGALRLQVQLLSSAGGWDAWPTEVREVDVRYSDVAPTAMRVPTLTAFVAMKTAAWIDRQAPRDLWDLAALARLGALDTAAADLHKARTGLSVRSWMFAEAPASESWTRALGGQTADPGGPEEALELVRSAWSTVPGWEAVQ